MGKLVLAMITSVDGIVATPDRSMEWAMPYLAPQLQGETIEDLRRTSTLLIGRRTYEDMAGFWPTQSNPMADLMNALPKVVFSHTLKRTEWNNSRLADGEAADVVRRLCQESDQDCRLLGGAGLAQSLSSLGLIDEYHLVTVPLGLGKGDRLFNEQVRLQLESSQSFDTGAVKTVYRSVTG